MYENRQINDNNQFLLNMFSDLQCHIRPFIWYIFKYILFGVRLVQREKWLKNSCFMYDSLGTLIYGTISILGIKDERRKSKNAKGLHFVEMKQHHKHIFIESYVSFYCVLSRHKVSAHSFFLNTFLLELVNK